jgi:DNA-binding transcriptional regulator LsrR (DeoR family)
MKRKRTDLDVLVAAYLAGHGVKRTVIADKLHLSQAVVWRLIQEAKKKKYLQTEMRFAEENVEDKEILRQVIERTSGSDKLANHVKRMAEEHGHEGPSVRVFPSGADVSEGETGEFARYAAQSVRQLLLRADNCGVTWGQMLWKLVSALRELNLPSPWRKQQQIEIVPLSGEPLGDEPTGFSSSSLAHELGLTINGGSYNAPYLGMVPAFLPAGFNKSEVKTLWRLIGLVRDYVEVFGSPDQRSSGEPLAMRLDMILTSAGPSETPFGFGKARLLESGNVKVKDLQKLIFGDIGGVCFPRKSKDREQQILESVTSRWTGLKEEHLRACARRARSHDQSVSPPGVVLVSRGAARATIVGQGIKAGLINHLLVDTKLADALEKQPIA